MDFFELPGHVLAWFNARAVHTRIILLLVVTVLSVELICRRWAPQSTFYRRWTASVEAVGKVWTAVILSLIYALSVGPISLALRLLRKDPLERADIHAASFWRPHDPGPLDPLSAARHQF